MNARPAKSPTKNRTDPLWLLGLAALFVASRLPSLTLDWFEGEPAFLVGSGGSLAERGSRWLVTSLAEPLAPGPARLLGVALGLVAALAFGRLMRRLVGRRTGPTMERLTLLWITLVPFLDSWLLDVRHLGDLGALALLGIAGERALTWKLRGGTWRLGVGLVAVGGATLASPTAWLAGPFLIALALCSYLNRESERFAIRRRRGALAALAALVCWAAMLVAKQQLGQPLDPLPELGPLARTSLENIPRTKALVVPGSIHQTLLLLAFLLLPLQVAARDRGGAWLRRWWPAPLVAAWILMQHGTGASPVASLGLALLAVPVLATLLRPAQRPGEDAGTQRTRQATMLGARLVALVLIGMLGWDHATGLRRQLHLDAHARSILAAVEGPVWTEAQAGSNSQVLLQRPKTSGQGQPGAGPGRDLPLVLAPPFRRSTIPLQLVEASEDGSPPLFESQRHLDPDFGKRSLVLLEPVPAHDWQPGDEHKVTVLRGWPGSASLGAGVEASPDALGGWAVTPPMPQHAFGAIELQVPSGGLAGRLLLLGPGLSDEAAVLASFDLEVTPAAPGQSIALSTRGKLQLGQQLARLTFEGDRAPLSPPRLLTAMLPPSILLPGQDYVLDLSSSRGPELQAWFDPRLLRPNAFRLDIELSAQDGMYDLSAGGAVPSGAPGELRLVPRWLDRTDQWRGPLPGERSAEWAEYLAAGLLRKLAKQADGQAGRWRLNLFWPGGLEAGSTPWEPIHWRASAPAPSD
ncbi:MAG: hypothetical protein P1V81_02215 [Planctomycetota bacterium]|nr:hypothetical protein [Planctomycetota bacterium]